MKILSLSLFLIIFFCVNVNAENIKGNGETLYWDKNINRTINFPNLGLLDGSIWEYRSFINKESEDTDWHSAKNYCSNLEIDYHEISFNDFRLPKIEELVSLYDSKILRDISLSRRSSYAKDFWSSTESGKDFALIQNMRFKGEFPSRRYKGHSRNLFVICILPNEFFDKYDTVDLAKLLFNSYLKDNSTVELEKKPDILKYNNLTKDEFETTSDFNKRKNEHRKLIDSKNELLLKEWENRTSIQKQEHNSKIRDINNNKITEFLKHIQISMALKYGYPIVKDVSYNADSQYFNIELSSSKKNYSETVKIPVGIKYARKFKEILKDQNFKPTILFKYVNNKLEFSSIKEIVDPEILVAGKEYTESYNSIERLNKFIQKYPKSPFLSKAKSRIISLKEEDRKKELRLAKLEKERVEREKRLKKQRIKNEKREREAYLSKKRVGDKVCMDGRVALGLLSVTITAFVERVEGDRIQLIINSTEGQSINYKGISLKRNSVIWDKYYEWKLCN